VPDHGHEIDADATVRRGPCLEGEVGDGVDVVASAEAILLLLEDDEIGDRLQRHKLALPAGEKSENATDHRRIGIGGIDGRRRASVAGADGGLERGEDRFRELPEEDPGAESVG
jgi:hypothetical protein